MTPERQRSPTERRAAYLAAALDLRRMAVHSQSQEAQSAFMRLVELYEELAEYSAITPPASKDGGFEPRLDRSREEGQGSDQGDS